MTTMTLNIGKHHQDHKTNGKVVSNVEILQACYACGLEVLRVRAFVSGTEPSLAIMARVPRVPFETIADLAEVLHQTCIAARYEDGTGTGILAGHDTSRMVVDGWGLAFVPGYFTGIEAIDAGRA
jgi:hypothetical protein